MTNQEIYSDGEIALIYTIIAIFSIVMSLIYLCLRINSSKLSCFIFILCFIYTTLFVFLVIIAIFDLFYNNQRGFTKFSTVILKYYEIFDYIDKILGFILFPLIIYYLESGHFTIFRRIIDGILGVLKELVQSLIYSFRILLFIALLIILIKYRKHYGIDNFVDYLFIMLDCYAVIEIYICVGFFMVQTIIDSKRLNNKQLTQRYRIYSLIKIMNKTDDYINKMKNLTVELKNIIKNNSKDKSSTEYINADKVLKKIEDKLKKYESENKEIIDPIIFQEVPSSDNLNDEVNDVGNNLKDLNNEKKNKNIKLGSVKNLNIKDIQPQQVEIKVNITEKKKKPENPVSCNKKYKKYIRRIDKLKLLYKEIKRETDENEINKEIENSKKNKNPIKCCSGVILFFSYFIAVLNDFLLPIFLQRDETYITANDNYEKEKSTISLSVGVILSMFLTFICNAYTVIVIYATKRRRYITGDYLYDKKINDNLNLLKTVQLICGYSFSLVYCNLYYWTTIDKDKVLGVPLFRRQIIIPDYTIKYGISVFMIIKVVIIIVSIIFSFVVSKISVFKNDLAEYNSGCSSCKYDSPNELEKIENEKRKIFYFLNN